MQNTQRYDAIVKENASETLGIKYVFKRNSGKSLLVSIGTHNANGRFPALTTLFDDPSIPHDILFISEEVNSYYRGDDQGVAYDNLILNYAKFYRPDSIVFFGSSMAGYCALRWALTHSACAVVSNPQVSLAASLPYAWVELKKTISKAGDAPDLSDRHFENCRAAIVSLWSQSLIDKVNFEKFMDMVMRNQSLSISIDRHHENQHSYLIKDYAHFKSLVSRALLMRSEMLC